jgi:hypothetical protein
MMTFLFHRRSRTFETDMLEACSTAPIVDISAVFSCYNNPLFGGGQGVRELQDEGKSLVIASEAKQSAFNLFLSAICSYLACTKDQRQAAAPLVGIQKSLPFL